MQTTIQLLHAALAREPNASFWCSQLEISRSTLAVAKLRGRLSPTLAGALADLMSENVERWVAIAALEAEPPSRKLNRVRKCLAHAGS